MPKIKAAVRILWPIIEIPIWLEMSTLDGLYGNLGFCRLPVEQFTIDDEITINRTYAHLFSPYILAFGEPEKPGQPHPGPWETLFSGFCLDVEAEVRVPQERIDKGFNSKNLLWWITALLRLQHSPLIRMPFATTIPISELPERHKSDYQIHLIELGFITIVPKSQLSAEPLTMSTLEWIRDYWRQGEILMDTHPRFNSAVQSCDSARFCRNMNDAILVFWGALERIFSDKHIELRYRIPNTIASYFYKVGPGREEAAKRIRKLYDVRSKAAHGAGVVDMDAYDQCYRLLQKTIIRMIESNHVPSAEELEANVINNVLWDGVT